ncbi:methylisocitrate lyase [Bosea sp. (in: a-proteobacteria)]|uniref:methylisocitrate lyase n=1 Tax=Bosea sp. (in: a-proteobacteria) TaxID=1871050 RepID=UPI002611A410|nr:methylisocitrate lyase [Bosea sp. (in: a-proteobacteria)]MCO5090588.1 methylisocitrate lyase [Bosea sp. (in: a-proteobacteria)]
MTWLVEQKMPTPPGDRMAELWRRPNILRIPGAHHAYAGIVAKRAGFEALYLSGGALSQMLGLPDLGIMTLEEVCFFARSIYRATGLPILVDGDTGYGEVLNVVRMVRELEDAGAAAVQIEDQILPKKCGHLNDKKLASPQEMAAKIAAARKARRHLRIVARTDALAQEGIEAAIARARLYLEAGADAIFPEALTSEEMFRTFARAVDAPLLANMTEFGRTPFFTAEQFEDFGFKMVIWPATSMRVASKALHELYATLAEAGTVEGYLQHLSTRAEVYDVIKYSDYEALDSTIAQSIVPPPLS